MPWEHPTERRSVHRRQDDAGQGLGRDDLYLLLESYRNSIELNTTLLAGRVNTLKYKSLQRKRAVALGRV